MTKIDIISGFLGAGKTTLIKKLLSDAYKGEQVVLIENEFGEIGIDGGFLKEAGIEIREMNSGCICCSLVGDFGKSLHEVVDTYHPDRILIEPSGVGKLSDVIKAVQDVQGEIDAELNSFTTVVDVTKCKIYRKNFGEFFSNQIEYAGAVILSRTDKAKPEKIQESVALLRELNEKAPIITTPIEQLPGEKILETMESSKSLEDELLAEVSKEAHDHEHHHHHDHEEHEHHHHDGECSCGCGHHHHDEDTEHLHTNKYQQAFAKFEAAGTTEEVTGRVKTLLGKHGNDNFTPDVLKQIHGFIDLTSLTSIDTKESIWKLVDKVNDFEGTRPDVPNVAAICTYPLFVETVKEALSAQEVKIASVAGGFPSSQTFMEIKIAETAMAVMQGADEIDVVMNLGYFLEENYDELSEEIQEIKESCRDAKLKVILETGALQTPESIQKAAVLAVYSGADFIKTSTGKGYPGATPEAVYTMCQVLKKYHSITGKRVGIKVAGGVRTAEEAVRYYTIVKEVLGNDWLNKDLFRIGASSLVEDIEHRLGK